MGIDPGSLTVSLDPTDDYLVLRQEICSATNDDGSECEVSYSGTMLIVRLVGKSKGVRRWELNLTTVAEKAFNSIEEEDEP